MGENALRAFSPITDWIPDAAKPHQRPAKESGNAADRMPSESDDDTLEKTIPECQKCAIINAVVDMRNMAKGGYRMTIDPQRTQPRTGERMSVREYFALDYTFPDAKYEYQDGKVRLMSGGTKAHDDIAFNTRFALKQQFLSGPCSVQGSDMRVQVSETAYFFPDVTITCDVADRRRDSKMIRSPRVVVEVLSPSTEKKDRNDKLRAYQACPTIQEIVLIDQFAPHVEIFRRREEDSCEWDHVFYEEGQEVELASVDVRIPIEEIYSGIDFDEPLEEYL
jgi:Uma2 family endonuclease